MKTKFDNVLIGFVIKSVFLSVVCVAFFTAGLSKLALVLDLDNSYYKYLGYFILFLSSFITAFISTAKFKNSLILMCLLSNLLVIILSVINSLMNKSFVQFVIDIFIIVISCAVAAVFNAKRSRKLKV